MTVEASSGALWGDDVWFPDRGVEYDEAVSGASRLALRGDESWFPNEAASGGSRNPLRGDDVCFPDRGVKYDELPDAGLLALAELKFPQGVAEDGYGDLGVPVLVSLRFTFGSAPYDRMGRRRRFCFTLLRSRSNSSISFEMSSEELSSSDKLSLSVGTMGDVSGDDSSSDDNWRVSSKSTSSESPEVDSEISIGDSGSTSIAGPRLSLARVRLIFGGRNRFASSESPKVDSGISIGDSGSTSIAGPRLSLAKVRLIFGGRNRFGGGISRNLKVRNKKGATNLTLTLFR